MVYEKKDDLMTALKAVIGESTDQSALDLIANINDTYDSLGSGLQSQLSDMTDKYNNLAKDYKARFFSGDGGKKPGEKKETDEKAKTLSQLLKGE